MEDNIIYTSLRDIVSKKLNPEEIREHMLQILHTINEGTPLSRLLFCFNEAEKNLFTKEEKERLLEMNKEEVII